MTKSVIIIFIDHLNKENLQLCGSRELIVLYNSSVRINTQLWKPH